MDADDFILSDTGVRVDSEHFDLSNLDVPVNTNKKVPDKFKHEFGSAAVGEFIGVMSVLLHK